MPILCTTTQVNTAKHSKTLKRPEVEKRAVMVGDNCYLMFSLRSHHNIQRISSWSKAAQYRSLQR